MGVKRCHDDVRALSLSLLFVLGAGLLSVARICMCASLRLLASRPPPCADRRWGRPPPPPHRSVSSRVR
jgi:hypothetical protein